MRRQRAIGGQRKRQHPAPSGDDEHAGHRGDRGNDPSRRHHSLPGNEHHAVEQLPPPYERRGGIDGRFVGEREQRLEIAASRVGGEHRQLVDDFLTRALDARDEIPDGGVEPEHRAQDLFAEAPYPVAASHVPQFVREHGALHAVRHRAQRLGQQHDRTPQAEGHRLADGGVLDLRARRAQRVEHVVRAGVVRRGAEAKAPQPQQSRQQPAQPRERPRGQHDRRHAAPGDGRRRRRSHGC